MFSPYQREISDARDRIELMGKLSGMGPSSLSRIPGMEGDVQFKILYNPFCRLTNPIILSCSSLNRSGYYYLHDVFKLNQSSMESVRFAIFSQLLEIGLLRFQDFLLNCSICWIQNVVDLMKRWCIRSGAFQIHSYSFGNWGIWDKIFAVEQRTFLNEKQQTNHYWNFPCPNIDTL